MATKTWLITLILSTIFVVGAVGSNYKDPESEALRLEARHRTGLRGCDILINTSITTDANSLKNMVNHFGRFDNMCHATLRDLDRTIVTILNQKLDDIKLLSDDVIHKVSQLKLNNWCSNVIQKTMPS
ncbi:unnamed protein product [Malus baccata var. baccata]